MIAHITRPVRRRLTASLLLVESLIISGSGVACADRAPQSRAAVRDSAGIRIVDNVTAGAPRWSTSPQPLVEIGASSAAPAYEFDGISGVALLGDGTVVVADRGSREVRAFGRDGRHRWTAGGPGEGPGEFAGEASLFVFRGDSLLAYDFAERRVTVLAPDGGVGRIVSLGHVQPNGELAGAFDDGSLLVSTRHLRLSPGVNQDSLAWLVCDSDSGGVLRELGSSRRRDVVLAMIDGFPVVDERPLAATGAAAAGAAGFVLTSGDAPELRLFDARGTLRTIARWDGAPQPLDAGTAEHWRAEDMAAQRNENGRRQRQRWLELATFPDRLPVTDGLVAGGDRVFALEFELPWSLGPRDWLVFDGAGRVLARLAMPRALDVHAIRDDVVAGVARDSLDVERVLLYSVVR